MRESEREEERETEREEERERGDRESHVTLLLDDCTT